MNAELIEFLKGALWPSIIKNPEKNICIDRNLNILALSCTGDIELPDSLISK